MDLLLSDHCPETCSAVGLDCGTCMRKAAANIAQICGGLDAQGVHQIFFQLYPSPGCRPMAPTFESFYREVAPPHLPRLAIAAAAA